MDENERDEDKRDEAPALSRRRFMEAGVSAAALLPLAGIAGCKESPPAHVDARRADTRPPDARKDAPPTVDAAGKDQSTEVVFDPSAVAEDEATFPLGVQAGAMTHSSALLWGYAEDDHPKRLRVWRAGSTPGKVVLIHDAKATPSAGYFHEAVAGLSGGSWYSYAFFAEGGADAAFTGRSAIGRFRAALAPNALEPVTVAATHGTKGTWAPWGALIVTAQHDYDLFCQLGDMSYNDGATSHADYRAKWKTALKDKGYRALLIKSGSYYTWDDHEIENDSKLYKLPPAQIKAGKDAFYEAVPAVRQAGDRLWTSYRWGKSVEFFVLDCRLERQPSTRKSADPIYISKAQLAWLKQGLSSSPCHFKVLLNSVPIIKMPSIWLKASDRWQGYAAQRDELLDHITQNAIPDVWFITGDFHTGLVGRLEKSGPRSKYFEIMPGPGGNGPNPLWLAYKVGGPNTKEGIAPKSQFDFFGGEMMATLITFDPKTDLVRVRFIDAASKKVLYDKQLSQG